MLERLLATVSFIVLPMWFNTCFEVANPSEGTPDNVDAVLPQLRLRLCFLLTTDPSAAPALSNSVLLSIASSPPSRSVNLLIARTDRN